MLLTSCPGAGCRPVGTNDASYPPSVKGKTKIVGFPRSRPPSPGSPAYKKAIYLSPDGIRQRRLRCGHGGRWHSRHADPEIRDAHFLLQTGRRLPGSSPGRQPAYTLRCYRRRHHSTEGQSEDCLPSGDSAPTDSPRICVRTKACRRSSHWCETQVAHSYICHTPGQSLPRIRFSTGAACGVHVLTSVKKTFFWSRRPRACVRPANRTPCHVFAPVI